MHLRWIIWILLHINWWNMKTKFINWLTNVFMSDELFINLNKFSENSPWHREKTIAIHTLMVTMQYLVNSPKEWTIKDVCGAISSVFHDVGKPACEIEKYKPERGYYRAYHGHEYMSARMWETYAVNNWNFLSNEFGLTLDDMYIIGLMIENHLPYDKVNLKDNLAKTIGGYEIKQAFKNFLLADTMGRISDDPSKLQNISNPWIDNFMLDCHTYNANQSNKDLIILIGASGSGKSTFCKNHRDAKVFSYDSLRLEWYDSDYGLAYTKSCEDEDFSKKTNSAFISMLKQDHASIIVDNINISRKSRRFFIEEGKKKGYKVIAVLFPVDINDIILRQLTRTDKSLSKDVVINQYNRIQYPMLGEFDEICVIGSNIPDK